MHVSFDMHSQELTEKPPARHVFLHLESGFIFPGGNIRESLAIRQNISSWHVHQPAGGNVFADSYGLVGGLRCEYFSSLLMSGISTGVRFIRYNTMITGYSSTISDFFYLRYSMGGSDTKFARVKSLTETNNYINIPVELKFIPLQFDAFGLFIKAGAEFSLTNLKKATDIEFQESAMEIHREDVLNAIMIATNMNYSTLYGSIGLTIGQTGRPNYIIEAYLPSMFLTGDNFTLTETNSFQGLMFSVILPLTRKQI
jgi:hypothetical protein